MKASDAFTTRVTHDGPAKARETGASEREWNTEMMDMDARRVMYSVAHVSSDERGINEGDQNELATHIGETR
jgi:hypothetical protein